MTDTNHAVTDLAPVPGYKKFLQFIFKTRPEWKSRAEGAGRPRAGKAQPGVVGAARCNGWCARLGHRPLFIGPGGVFTINSKHHRSSKAWVRDTGFLVSGRRHPFARNPVHEAARASELLSAACGFTVPAAGVVSVVFRPGKLIVHEQLQGGVRVEHKSVGAWIESQERRLTDDQVEAVYASSQLPATWGRADTGPSRRVEDLA